ncbi:MAG: NAD(P)H-dependent oxidoreductase [Alphaproteobacteria bacterium]|nr:NAD(P)H-dependent oxidoreductase [Alphaproteobacteria bacterium]
MSILHLTAHPLADSFHAALAARIADSVAATGHVYDRCDLYQEGFDPVLSAEERLGYHASPANQQPVADAVQRLMAARVLIVQFPVWIFGPPAILKGWFDRVFLPGVAFRLEDGRPRPGLGHIRAVIGLATYGTTRPFAWWMGDPPRHLVRRYLAWCCGGADTRFLPLYGMNTASASRRAHYLDSACRTVCRMIG